MDFREAKIGFIGFGSMAAAICDGLLMKKVVEHSAIYACASDMEKLRKRCEELAPASDNALAALAAKFNKGK